MDKDKLIITCATTWEGYEDVPGMHIPKTATEIADSVAAARDAGAALAHVHPPTTTPAEGPAALHVENWRLVRRLVRERTDVIFEHGLGGLPYILFEHNTQGTPTEEQRKGYVLDIEKPEAIAVLINEVDFKWGDKHFYMMPTRAELEHYMKVCDAAGVKPSFEIWHEGSFFNLEYLRQRGVIHPPFWLTLFFGANGGMAAPATLDNLAHRVREVPSEAYWQVATFCGVKGATTKEQFALVAHAIALGGHVRVGMEDNPYVWDGVPARSNAELVERVVKIGRALGREIAEPDEVRDLLGIPRLAPLQSAAPAPAGR